MKLPALGIDVAFNGSGVVVSGLPEGQFRVFEVRALSEDGESEWSENLPVWPTQASDWETEGENSPATGAPTISGPAQVGGTLTADASGIADADGLDNASFSYQWTAGDADISDATGSTYTPDAGDVGKTIKVRASFTDDADNQESLTSAATDTVAGQPPEPLTASLENTPDNHDGETPFTFKLSYKTLKFHAFTVEGGTVKKAQRMDKPSNIHWRITVEPDSSADVRVVLPGTEDGRRLSNRLELTGCGPGQ